MQVTNQPITTKSQIIEISNKITDQIKKEIDCAGESTDIVPQESKTEQFWSTGEDIFNQLGDEYDLELNNGQMKSSESDHWSQNQKIEWGSSQQRKKKKFLQKKEILELRDIFQQHPDPTIQSEHSSQNLAKKYNVCRQTISRLRSAFFRDPTLRQFLQKDTKTSATGRIKGSMNQSTKVVRTLIYNELATNRYITRKELQQAIMGNLATMELSIKVPTLKTISKILKSLNIVRKRIRQVPKTRNEPDIIQKRFNFCQQYILISKTNADIIFYDSRAFDIAQPSSFAWIERGTDPQYEKPSSKGIKVSLLTAISRGGIIEWETRVGNYSTTQFTRVSMKILTSVQSRSKNEEKYLVLNGAKTHCQMALKQILNEQRYKLVYLPAYCPQLNAIQYWFNQVRDSVNKRKFHTVYQLQNVINQECSKLKIEPHKSYIEKINRWVQLGLKKQKF